MRFHKTQEKSALNMENLQQICKHKKRRKEKERKGKEIIITMIRKEHLWAHYQENNSSCTKSPQIRKEEAGSSTPH